MANDRLILRTINSPYGDLTRNSVLSHEDVDNNFIYLKSNQILTATTEGGHFVIKKTDGSLINIPFTGSGISQDLDSVTSIGKTTDNNIQIGAELGIKNLTNVNIGSIRVDYLNNNRIFQLPDNSGIGVISINGQVADNYGNILLSGVTATTPNIDAVSNAGSATTNSIGVGALFSNTVSANTYTGFIGNLESLNFYKAGGVNVITFYNPDLDGLINLSIDNVNGIRNHQLPNNDGVYLVSINGQSGDSTGNIIINNSNQYLTGVSFNNNVLSLYQNTGGTLSVLIDNFDHLKVLNAITATTYYGDGSNLTGVISTDMAVTGGTYNPVTGVATFTNNSGATFNVGGFLTGLTDTDKYLTGGTFSANTLTLKDNSGSTVNILLSNFSGLTVSNLSSSGNRFIYANSGGSLTYRTFSANTIPFGSNGDLAENANFTFDGANLYVGNGNGATQCGIVLNANRGSLTAALNGFDLRVGSSGGGIPDTSKSFKFYNKGVNYLQLGSSSLTTHYAIFSSGLTINIPTLASTGNSMVYATSSGDLAITSMPTGLTDTNFAINDLTATSDRVHNWNNYDFTMNNLGVYTISTNSLIYGDTRLQISPEEGFYLISNDTSNRFSDVSLGPTSVSIRVYDPLNGTSQIGIDGPDSSGKGLFSFNGFNVILNDSLELLTGTPTNYLTVDSNNIIRKIPYSSDSNTYTTGATFSNNNLVLTNNTGGTVSTLINNFSGLTVNGVLSANVISASTISGATLYGDGSNLTGIVAIASKITGATFSNNNLVLTNNTGGTVSTLINNFSGLTVNGVISASTISGATLYGDGSNLTGIVAIASKITGITFTNNNLVLTNNTGGTVSTLINNFSGLTVNGVISANVISASTISGATLYGSGSNLTGIVANTNIITGITFTNNNLTIRNNTGGTITTLINNFSGLTVNGNAIINGSVSGNSITLNGDSTANNGIFNGSLKIGINSQFQFGSTRSQIYSNSDGQILLTNSSNNGFSSLLFGGTGNTTPSLYINGVALDVKLSNNSAYTRLNAGSISASTISGATLYGDGSNLTGIVIVGVLTGATFSNNTLILTNNTGGTVSTLINNFSGLTVSGIISASTISGATLYGNGSNLTGIIGAKITSGSFTNNNLVLTNNTGGTVSTLINNFSGLTTNNLTIPSLSGSNRVLVIDTNGTVSATTDDNIFNTQTGLTYTCVLNDAQNNGFGKTIVEMNNVSPNIVIIPPNSAVTFNTGSSITITQFGSGQTTISGGTGVTILSAGGALKLANQYSFATIIKRNTNTWYLTGDITT